MRKAQKQAHRNAASEQRCDRKCPCTPSVNEPTEKWENHAIEECRGMESVPLKSAAPLSQFVRCDSAPPSANAQRQAPRPRSQIAPSANDGPDRGGLLGCEAGAAGGAWTFGEGQSHRRLGKIGNRFCSLSHIACTFCLRRTKPIANEGLSGADRETCKDAAERALIRDLATDPAKREVFDRLASHLTVLADQVEMAMVERKAGTDPFRP